MTYPDMWTYREDTYRAGGADQADLIGYDVVALDGSIGKIDESTFEAGASYIVVDTGPWIFGKKVLLPAGVIQSVDHNDASVAVNRTKDQIKDSPRFDETSFSESLRDDLGTYYGADRDGFV